MGRTLARRWRVAAIAMIALAAAALVFAVRGILTPFILAFVIAYLLEPVVRLMERHGVPRPYGIIIIYLVGLGLVAVGLGFFLPTALAELAGLAESVPQTVTVVQSLLESLRTRYTRLDLPEAIRAVTNDALARAQRSALLAVEALATGLLSIFRAIPILFLSPVLAFYLLRDMDRFKRAAVDAMPVGVRGEVLTLLAEIDHAVGGFIRGQLVVAAVVGVLAFVGLQAVGMPYAVVGGLLAATGEVIPYFGPFIGGVPIVLLALARSPQLALTVAVVLIVIQQVESIFIAPRIVGHYVGLHPLMVIFALLAGASLGGVIGMLVAVPAIGVTRAILGFIVRLLSAPA